LSIYIAPRNSCGPTEALLVRLAPREKTSFKKRQDLRRDKDVERLEDKKEAEGGRRFQREGPITEKDGHLQNAHLQKWVVGQ